MTEHFIPNRDVVVPEALVERNLEAEREARIEYILELYEKDLNLDQAIGLHGTSLQALQRIVEDGHLPSAGEIVDTEWADVLSAAWKPLLLSAIVCSS